MKYVSGRLKELKIGITSYSEDKTPLEVVGSVSVGGSLTVNKNLTVNNIAITSTTSTSEFANLSVTGVSTFGGNVAIGTDDVNAVVSAANTTKLAVGILTANRIFSTVFGQFTGGSVLADSIVGTGLSISGISTFGGNVAIGTDDATKVVGAGNTSILAVGILTANRIFSTVFGQFTGGSVLADNIVGTGLSISGISTLGTVQISSGIVTASSGVVTYFGDGSNLTGTGNTTNVRTDSLVVSGVSTFNDLVDINDELNTQGGRIVGAATSNVIPFLYANYSDLPSPVTYHGAFAHVHATGKAYYAHAGAWFELVNKEADGRVGTGTEGYNVGHIDATSLDVSGISTFNNVDIDGNLDVDGYSRFDGIKIDEGGLVIVSGVSTISGDVLLDTNNSQNIVFSKGGNSVKFGDNTKALFGNSSDLQIYHQVIGVSGTSYIDNNTGALYIRNNVDDDDGGNIIIEAKAGKASAVFQDDEGVRLYYNDAEKIATTGYGVTVNGTTQTQQLNVSGISTLANTVVGGATTELLVTGDARVTGELKVGDGTITLNSAGISTFPTGVNIGQVSISTTTASSFPFDVKVGSAITFFGDTGIVTATSYRGDGSELVGVAKSSVLEDNGINPIGVSTFNNLDVTGITTIDGNLVANGNIIGDGATNISGINSVTATSFHGDGSGLENVGVDTGTINTDSLKVSGISTFTGNIDANGQLDVDGLSTLDDVVATGFVTFANTLKVGSSLDVDGSADIAGDLVLGSNVNIAGLTTIAGDITVGGNITGDGSTVISGVTSVIATKFFGNGEGITGITADSLGDLDHLKVTGLSTFVGNSQFDGNVSIAGTLTYEDVTNVDSIGVITARSGIIVGAGISAVGIVTANGFVGSGNSLTALNANNLSSGVVPDARFPATLPAVSGANLTSLNASELSSGTVPDGRFPATLPAASGVNLTNVSAVFATKAGIATYTSSWVVTANGASHYRFAGPGNLSTQDDPTIYLVRGQQYEFDLNVSGHPFLIRVSNGGSQYTDGVTTVGNNQTGKIRFDVPMDAPSELFYQCQYHSGMFGKFEITDGSKIVQGNSKVEVVDTGSNGHVKVETEGTERLRINSSGHVVPGTDSQYDIGTNTVRFANIYGDVLYGDGSNLTGITAAGTGAIGGLTIKSESGIVVGTAGSVATIDFNNSTGVTVTATSGASGIASVVIAGVGTDTSVNTTGIITAIFSGDGQDLEKVSFGSTDGNFIGKGYLQAQKTVNAGGSRGNANIILGRFAGCCHDGSSYNIYLGDQAGRNSSSGSTNRNVFIGCQAGCGNTTGYHNVFVGSEAGKGQCGDSGCQGVFIGQKAGINNTGDYNIAFGKMAYGRQTGTKNIAIGFHAANDVGAGGTSNVFIGEYAGAFAQNENGRGSQYSVYLGHSAGYSNPGDYNIGIGDQALNGTFSYNGCRNIGLGQCSGSSIQSGTDNILLGSCSGAKITTGNRNILLGLNAGCCAKTLIQSVYVGCNSGKNICSGQNDIAIGVNAFCDSKHACGNIGLGLGVFQKLNCGGQGTGGTSAGRFNFGAGYSVGIGMTLGDCNIMMGYIAGYCITDGDSNIFIGQRAGQDVISSCCNIFIGTRSGGIGTAVSSDNVFVGNYAGAYTGSTTRGNTFLGKGAGFCATGGCFNVAVGEYAACGITGDRNVFIGNYAGGSGINSGNCNVAIGPVVSLPSASGSNQLVIGVGCTSWVSGDSSYNVTLAGIATATKSTGVFEATKFCGDGSCLTGISAGFNADSECNLFSNNTCSGCNFDGTADNNILLGACAGKSITSSCYNVIMGSCAGATLTGGRRNILIGQCSGYGLTSGVRNVIIGCSGKTLTTGPSNIWIGMGIGDGGNAGNTNDSVVIGHYAGHKITNAHYNLFLGAQTGYNNTSGCRNIFLGHRSVYCNTTGHFNIAFGTCMELPIESGSNQLAIGCVDKYWIVGNCDFNVGIGTTNPNAAVGVGNTNKLSVGIVSAYQLYGDGSCLTGIDAGLSADAQGNLFANNTCSGCNFCGTNAENNILLGCCTGKAITCGDNNIFMGKYSGDEVNIGSCNIGLGWKAGSGLTTACCNVYIGACAGANNTAGDLNTAIGPNAALQRTGGTANVFIGRSAGTNNGGQTGNCNIGIGFVTLGGANSDADFNIAIGQRAGKSATSGGCNIFLGLCSAENLTTGADNIVLGRCAMQAGTVTGNHNITFGYQAGLNISSGNCNVLIGRDAGKCVTAGVNNVFIGTAAGNQTSTDTNYGNVGLGFIALQCLTTGGCNFAANGYSGCSITTGSHNITIGEKAGRSIDTGNGNIFLGQEAGCNTSVSGCNIFIGHHVGKNATSAASNIAIGFKVELPSATANCQLAIGVCNNNWIVGNSDFNVGIGTTNPKTDFQVGSHYGVVGGGGTFTAAAGVAHTINEYTIATTDFKTAEYTIFANTGSKIQSQKLLVMQDGTTAYSQEYAVMSSDTQLVSAGANITSGVVKIELTPETGVSGLTTFRFTRHTML